MPSIYTQSQAWWPATSALGRQMQADPWSFLESASSWMNDETLSQKDI